MPWGFGGVPIDWSHNEWVSVLACSCIQVQVAEEFGMKLRAYQDAMHPAAYGDSSREWAHLVLTKVSPIMETKCVRFWYELQICSLHAVCQDTAGNDI